MELKVIAKIHTDFPEKFGLPRQSGLVKSLRGTIVFEKPYRNADSLRGLDGYSHLWLIWGFSDTFASAKEGKAEWSPTVRPPRLGGNKRVGVFATRSPNRPNPLALSCVKLDGIKHTPEGDVLLVSGIDMTDGTPIYDIKPYLPHVDAISDAVGGFSTDVSHHSLSVDFPIVHQTGLSDEFIDTVTKILSQDPRPSYQNDDSRVYYLSYEKFRISFIVKNDTVTVTGIAPE